MATKSCSRCNRILSLAEFADRGNGFKKSACRQCTKARKLELNPPPVQEYPEVLVMRLNHAAALWFGPVDRQIPLRWMT